MVGQRFVGEEFLKHLNPTWLTRVPQGSIVYTSVFSVLCYCGEGFRLNMRCELRQSALFLRKPSPQYRCWCLSGYGKRIEVDALIRGEMLFSVLEDDGEPVREDGCNVFVMWHSHQEDMTWKSTLSLL